MSMRTVVVSAVVALAIVPSAILRAAEATSPGSAAKSSQAESSSGKASNDAASAIEKREANYTQAIEKRTQDILVLLDIKDPVKLAKVHDAIIAQYRALRDWHDTHDVSLKELRGKLRTAAGDEARLIEEQNKQIAASLKKLHDEFLAKLTQELTPEQVDKVKDKMTYNKVQVTYDGYRQMLLNLSDEQKAHILQLLKEARELAMDGGSSEEKTAIFEKYKGKINNYLSAQGYDLKQAGIDWAERRKGNRAEK